MNSRKRVLTALEHKEPDRVPIGANLTLQVAESLSKIYNIQFKKQIAFLSNRISFNEVLVKLGNDMIFVGACAPSGFSYKRYPDGSYDDEGGIRRKKIGYYDEIIKHPLASVETVAQLNNYFDKIGFPDPNIDSRFNFATEEIRRYSKNYAVTGVVECTMFELSWYLVGMEKILKDLVRKKNYVLELIDKIKEFHIEIGKNLVKLGCDIILTGDDFGTQTGMLISPKLWREIFKSRFSMVFDQLKRANKNIKIAYHSCGSIVPIISDLIEIGLDILNPLQPRASRMDGRVLKEKYGNQLSFWGAIDEQKILPFGTSAEVKKEVREKISNLAHGGGYIIAPAHNIQPDTPLKNIFSFYATAKEYGKIV
jgi:uroporphyrinogen decarboxylase